MTESPPPTVLAANDPPTLAVGLHGTPVAPAPDLPAVVAGVEPGVRPAAPTAAVADAVPPASPLPPPPPVPQAAPDPAAPATTEGGPAANDPALAGAAPETAPPVTADAENAPDVLARAEPLPPVPGLGDDAPGVRILRLPGTGAAGSAGNAATGPAPDPAGAGPGEVAPDAAAPAEDDRPAIDRFARAFDNPAGKPLFAVVLIDSGEPTLDRSALAALPFPVTFLLDPSRPEAALAASIYRGAGQEVAMLATGLPEGATASDLEVTFAAYAEVLPEAVAVVDPETDGFQGNRPVATLVAPIVAGQGRGLLSWDRGLNAADQVARREGLRSGVVYRRLDGEGEDTPLIRRYLDRAAFKAAQDGRVIVAGTTRPETVAALLEWAVEGRAATVALAPLSAALQAQ